MPVSSSLAGLYPIIDLDATEDPLGLASAVLRGGAAMLQLRAKGRPPGEIEGLARTLLNLCTQHHAVFIINDYVELAGRIGAGVHVGQGDLPVAGARRLLGPDAVVGLSTNNVAEARQGVADGASYIAVGAIFPTQSKFDTRPAGLARLREVRAAVGVPLVAIGGIDEANAASVVAAGADALAVIGVLAHAEDPEAAARRLVAIIRREPKGTGVDELDPIIERIRGRLAEKYRLRERGLQVQREVIRASANAIRAVHRGEFEKARTMVTAAGQSLHEVAEQMAAHADIRYAGFLQDAEKEYAEAALTLAIVAGEPLPSPDDLQIGDAPYLNGLGETVGELRREVLDILRRGDIGMPEHLLQAMDNIYGMLVTIDYPDSLTAGLRRTTDSVRGILERTRGDLTMAIRQSQLEAKLSALNL